MATSHDDRSARAFWNRADSRASRIARTFAEIQSGPNPLTAGEIRALAHKRPDVWARFLPYADAMERTQ